MPVVFVVGYILPAYIHFIPTGPGSNALFYTSITFAVLLAASSFIVLARILKFTKVDVILSLAFSGITTVLVAAGILYYLLNHVGGA